jgi:hypothetical protein
MEGKGGRKEDFDSRSVKLAAVILNFELTRRKKCSWWDDYRHPLGVALSRLAKEAICADDRGANVSRLVLHVSVFNHM